MNSPPYHYPYHHYHDPTIINVHTLLKPQPYQYPSYNNTQPSSFVSQTPFYQQPYKIPTSVIHQNDFSNPPSTLTSSYHTPSISSTDIGFILNQISHSQEILKNSLSDFANEVALLKTTLTPHFNEQSLPSNSTNFQTHNGYYYQNLSHTQQQHQQQSPPSIHNTQHPILTTAPSPFNNTHTKPKQNCFSHIPSHHHHTPFSISTELSETTTVTNKRPTTDEKIIPNIVHGHEFAVTTKFVEPEINNIGDLHEHVVSDGDFNFLIVDSISQVDDKENKFVTIESVGESVYRISKPQEKPVNATMRLAPDLMRFSYSMFAKSFSAATASLPEKTVPRVVIVTTPFIRRSFIFDPGGAESLSAVAAKLDTVKFLKMKRRRQPATVSFLISGAALGAASGRPWVPWYRLHSIANGGVDVFDPDGNEFKFHSPARIDGNNRHTLSLLWLPWDRGKFWVCNGLETVWS